jgi:hypothetical protein
MSVQFSGKDCRPHNRDLEDLHTRFVGAYQMRPGLYMTITMSGEQLMSRLGDQDALPIFAEANDKFFPKAVDAEMEFVKDSSGKITNLVLHQNGHDTQMHRLNDAEGKRIIDESAARASLAAQRFKDQKPAPGAEDAIRQDIADILAGQPKYDRMSPGLADVTRQQLPQLKTIFSNLGVLRHPVQYPRRPILGRRTTVRRSRPRFASRAECSPSYLRRD